ncbi:3764_t:CDS:1, partial [Acaulospora colombiana]
TTTNAFIIFRINLQSALQSLFDKKKIKRPINGEVSRFAKLLWQPLNEEYKKNMKLYINDYYQNLPKHPPRIIHYQLQICKERNKKRNNMHDPPREYTQNKEVHKKDSFKDPFAYSAIHDMGNPSREYTQSEEVPKGDFFEYSVYSFMHNMHSPPREYTQNEEVPKGDSFEDSVYSFMHNMHSPPREYTQSEIPEDSFENFSAMLSTNDFSREYIFHSE